MDDPYFKKIIPIAVFFILVILAFLIIKPIIMSIILGFILAFIFGPLYNFVFRLTKAKNLSAGIICALLVILIVLPLWFFTPMVINQAFKIYQTIQTTDFVTPLKSIFPSLFSSEEFSQEIGAMLHSFITGMADSLVNSLADIILKFPAMMLQFLVIIFTFYFALRDRIKLNAYLRSVIPYSKKTQDELFASSKAITSSVLYGQVILGIVQGVVVGLGFLIFGIPSALILTLLAILAGVIPIIGPMLVWVPVIIYLAVNDSSLFSIIGIFVFGFVGSNIDNLLRPMIVSKASKLNSAIILIGMIGGLFLFGILGLIMGPLILAYLFIILDLYRDQSVSEAIEKKEAEAN